MRATLLAVEFGVKRLRSGTEPFKRPPFGLHIDQGSVPKATAYHARRGHRSMLPAGGEPSCPRSPFSGDGSTRTCNSSGASCMRTSTRYSRHAFGAPHQVLHSAGLDVDAAHHQHVVSSSEDSSLERQFAGPHEHFPVAGWDARSVAQDRGPSTAPTPGRPEVPGPADWPGHGRDDSDL